MPLPIEQSVTRVNPAEARYLQEFADIVRLTSGVVTTNFQRVRPDAATNTPPVILHKGANPDFTYRYRPYDHLILCPEGQVESEISGCSRNVTLLKCIMTEEFIHAQSTQSCEGSTRTGFINFPFPQQRTRLSGGRMYRFQGDMVLPPPHNLETDRALTENLTALLVHSMLAELDPRKRAYRDLALITKTARSLYGDNSLLLPKQPDLIDTWMRSLYTGDATGIRDLGLQFNRLVRRADAVVISVKTGVTKSGKHPVEIYHQIMGEGTMDSF